MTKTPISSASPAKDLAQSARLAAATLAGACRQTPLLEVSLGGTEAFLKLENLQVTGSFKYRGAMATIRAAQTTNVLRGCVTYSAGNHGRAVAHAAKAAGVPAVVVMPNFAEPAKVRLVEAEGATVVQVAGDALSASAHQICEESGYLFIHPFDQLSVMAGQGTVGLEILSQLPAPTHLDALFVPVGGGGLLSGIAAVFAEASPNTRVIAVEPARAADLGESLRTETLVAWDRSVTTTTIADGLRAPSVGAQPWEVIRSCVTDSAAVDEQEIIDAMRSIFETTGTVAEPSAAVAVAAVTQRRSEWQGKRVAAVVTGSNVSPTHFAELLA